MKGLLFFIFFLFAAPGFSQHRAGYENNPDSMAAEIVRTVTANDSTDLQKVYSIFKWITSNIDYSVGGRFGAYFPAFASDWDREYWEDDTTNAIPSLDKRVSAIVLKKRVAVCDGYARLFKTLCVTAGIKAEVVSGFGRANGNERNFTTNHRWNAVFVDSSWKLLDATWAAGYINYNNRFQRNFNSYYFLTPPEKFFNDHYPEDQRWMLMPSIPVANEFKKGPFLFPIFQKYFITSFSPVSGIINASVGDTIVFELETKYPYKTLWASDFTYLDSASVMLLQCCGMEKPKNEVTGNFVRYEYKVMSADSEWLHLVYDDEIIMRYKLNIVPRLEILAGKEAAVPAR